MPVDKLPANTDDIDDDNYFEDEYEEDWENVTADNWKTALAASQKEILRIAKQKKLNYKSLERCLKVAAESKENEGLIVLPYAAYFGRYKGKKGWEIRCSWEDEQYFKSGSPFFGHGCEWIIDANTGKVLRFTTCD